MTLRGLILLAISLGAIAQSLPGDRVISSDSDVGALSFSADGTLIAATCADGQVRLWDARSGDFKRAVPFGKDTPATALSSGADLLAVRSGDGGVQSLDLKTRQMVRRFTVSKTRISPFVFSRDGKLVAGATRASGGSENTVRVWNAAGVEQLALPAGIGGISTIAFSPDGGTLVAGGYDTDLRAWSTRDGELLRVMDELPLAMFAAAFSPDGKYLATAGADRIVYLWDTKTWKIARRLSGQPEMISAMAFSPDGRLLLTGGSGEFNRDAVKALLWDISSGKPIRSMPSAHMVRSAVFSPDGTRMATATSDQKVSIWAVPSGTIATHP